MVGDKGIEPHVPVWDRGERKDGTFSRSDFVFDSGSDTYTCPGGNQLKRYRRRFTHPRSGTGKDDAIRYRAIASECGSCPMKERCCPNTATRKLTRRIHEAVRDVAREVKKTAQYAQSRKDRKKVETLFGHLKRILKLDRLRLRGMSGAHDEFLLAGTAQNLRRMAMWLSTGPPKHRIGASA